MEQTCSSQLESCSTMLDCQLHLLQTTSKFQC